MGAEPRESRRTSGYWAVTSLRLRVCSSPGRAGSRRSPAPRPTSPRPPSSRRRAAAVESRASIGTTFSGKGSRSRAGGSIRWIIQSFSLCRRGRGRSGPAAARRGTRPSLSPAPTSPARRCRSPRSSSSRRRTRPSGSRPPTRGRRAGGPRCGPPCGSRSASRGCRWGSPRRRRRRRARAAGPSAGGGRCVPGRRSAARLFSCGVFSAPAPRFSEVALTLVTLKRPFRIPVHT